MSLLWTATTAFVFIAALSFRVLIATRYRTRCYAPNWLEPAILALLLLTMGGVLISVGCG
jgi:hypothetical protein